MMQDEILWMRCESRTDCEHRIGLLASPRVFPWVEGADASEWGYWRIADNRLSVLPMGYCNVGLMPQHLKDGERFFAGVSDLVVGYDLRRGEVLFRYRMPTTFHEFIVMSEKGILVQDEIGFVLLSREGRELWTYCFDIIQSYELFGDDIVAKTLEGEEFRVTIGNHQSS